MWSGDKPLIFHFSDWKMVLRVSLSEPRNYAITNSSYRGTNVQLKREHDSSVRNQFINVVSRSTTDCGQAVSNLYQSQIPVKQVTFF